MYNLTVDQISFGNPCSNDLALIKKETYLDRLLPDLYAYNPPKNSSQATRDELESLVRFVNSKRDIKNNLYDEALVPHITKLFVDAGANEEHISDVTKRVAEDCYPIITKLKYYFNRPRPSQLAHYLDVKLFPDFSYFTNSPSFPSCHTTLTTITCEVLGNHYPEAYSIMQKLIDDVMASRMYLGVHYPSDNDMARVIAKKVVGFPEFMAKFKL
jgi:PAP2 superfamily